MDKLPFGCDSLDAILDGAWSQMTFSTGGGDRQDPVPDLAGT